MLIIIIIIAVLLIIPKILIIVILMTRLYSNHNNDSDCHWLDRWNEFNLVESTVQTNKRPSDLHAIQMEKAIESQIKTR